MKGSTFSIEQGQLFCLLGPNGAGKTTTINCLTGVMPPSGIYTIHALYTNVSPALPCVLFLYCFNRNV